MDLWKYTLKQFSDCDLWQDEYNKVLEKCTQTIALGEKWLTTCTQLTTLFWPSYSSHPWKEEVYRPVELVQLLNTLREVCLFKFPQLNLPL